MTAILVGIIITLVVAFVLTKIHGRQHGVLGQEVPRKPVPPDAYLAAWDEVLAATSHAAVFRTLSEDMRWQLHPAHRPCPKARDPRRDHLWMTEVTTWDVWGRRRNEVLPGQTRRWHRCDACGIQIADRPDFWLDTAEQRRYAPPYHLA